MLVLLDFGPNAALSRAPLNRRCKAVRCLTLKFRDSATSVTTSWRTSSSERLCSERLCTFEPALQSRSLLLVRQLVVTEVAETRNFRVKQRPKLHVCPAGD